MSTQFDTLCKETTLCGAWSVVKSKGSAGGIDGVGIQEFEKEKKAQIALLIEELKNGSWNPFPYLEVQIPKTKEPAEKHPEPRFQERGADEKALHRCFVFQDNGGLALPKSRARFVRAENPVPRRVESQR